VSVIIPAYNRADLVGRAIRSAQNQAPAPPEEIIVVDDCSSDATAEIARDLGASVIQHQQNQGEAGARNTGLQAAGHEWVAFLDSDDEWLPGHLASLWPRRGGHVAVAATAVYRLNGQLRMLGHPSPRPRVIASPADLVFPSNPVPVSGVIAQREPLLALDGFRPWKTGADLDMWIRLLGAGTVLACPEPGYIYHLHAGQVSSDSELMRGNLLRLVESYDGAGWCTDRVLERVSVVNAWDALQAARRTRDRRATARHLAWLAARPQRVQALLEMWLWRFRVRRRTAHVRVPSAPALSDT
jgi:glycosyltransferase involved in cell wall biosynthesis